MGIPKHTFIPLSLWDRLLSLSTEKHTIVENTSYVQNGVLYLIPEDFAFFMDIRRFGSHKEKDTP